MKMLQLGIAVVLLLFQHSSSVPCNELFPAMLCCLDQEHLYRPVLSCSSGGTIDIPCFPRAGINCTPSTASTVGNLPDSVYRCADQQYSQADVARMEVCMFWSNGTYIRHNCSDAP
jgi:hypothetical protein